ncbi:hypothetical protein ML401_18870 [Bradyrhizobium sp. 62B]|uniref:hypothetical protein n=1 Tax=Bradyrhizobium sp. 62B TaxID=2898442 RepID=UPI002557FF94|nr:hypothetical protein ML401_18870 [Bradyrhizobium sp. 62B]
MSDTRSAGTATSGGSRPKEESGTWETKEKVGTGISEFLKRIKNSPAAYALAACCVVGPLLLGYGAPNMVAGRLMPVDKKPIVDFVLPDLNADTDTTNKKNDTLKEKQSALARKQATLQRLKATPGSPPDAIDKASDDVATADMQEKIAADEVKRAAQGQVSDRTIAQSKQIADALTARYNYAAVSGVLYLVSAATLLLGSIIIARRSRALLVAGLVGFGALALFGTLWPTAYANAGLTFLDFLLNKTDANGEVFKPLVNAYYESAKSFKISSALKCIIDVNTFVGLWAVGIALLAFAVLSSPADEPTLPNLEERKTDLQWMIVLSSAILVVATVASKLVMDGPLALLVKLQAEALKPLADALTGHLGITGTIALLAAAVPALAGWYWDVKRYRGDPANAPVAGSKETDKLQFATSATVSSILAILAPALTSPVFASLKALIDLVAKNQGAG